MKKMFYLNLKKGNKKIQCGGCGKIVIVKMNGKTGYATCICGKEYYIKNDPYYGISQILAKI